MQGAEMLTATYTLAAISAEQKKARTILSRLRDYIDEYLMRLQELDLGKIEATLNNLTQFDRYCHARKVEKYLIPSVRGTAQEIDKLVAELESMSARAVEKLQAAQEKLRQVVDQGIDKVRELFRAMEAYCDSLLTRLEKEEEELLPLLGRLLPGDEWFEIAAKFLRSEEGPRRQQVAPPHVPQPG
jgi:hemerythrin-like domain-containing protein